MATHRKIKLKQQLRKLHSHQFLLSIASFGLVLPLHSLPELRQHQIMMIIIGIYAVVNLSYGMRRKNSLSPVYHLFESWCLYTVVMLFVSTNQGMRGDFFPLLYVTILIIGFTLPEKMSLTIASCMFLTLFAWDKPLLPYLPVQEKMLYLLKFFSLMVFSPFIILLAHHYEKA
ncbi:MAG TPA: hypothetical protein PKL83_06665, partial [bacterium]|nr:hypothetical protein [bacterium]